MDPFLQAHSYADQVLELGGGRTPISFRDQIFRAQLLVERCLEQGLLARDSRLLVIGGGVSGIAAAMSAANLGIVVDILEQEQSPLSRQARCTTRWIEPTLYDWPLGYWEVSTNSSDSIIKLEAGMADTLVGNIRFQFDEFREAHPSLQFFSEARLTSWSRTSDQRILAEFICAERPGIQSSQNYDLVILCLGFGAERVTVMNYRGFTFWENDPFAKPGLGTELESLSVVISGGGDGALIDALRCVTGLPSARHIINSAWSTEDSRRELASTMTNLQRIEDQLQRSLAWAGRREHIHRAMAQADLEYGIQIMVLLAGLDSGLVTELSKLRRDGVEVHLVYPCSHFGVSYGLNRFLVAAFAQARLLTLWPNHRVVNVTPRDPAVHRCGTPADCVGENHEITWLFAPSCEPDFSEDADSSEAVEAMDGVYQGVIIRHGTPVATSPLRLASSNHPRQLLPYSYSRQFD